MDDMLKTLGINTNGIRYEDMSMDEKKTLHQWLDSVSKNELTVEKIKEFVHQIKDAIEQEFTRPDLPDKQEIFVKARLKNIMMLESFLLGPDRAKKALETAIKSMK